LIKLGELGGTAINKVLDDFDLIQPVEQNPDLVSYSGKIEKQDGLIVFEAETACSVLGKFKAFKLWPGIFFLYKNIKFQIIECERITESEVVFEKNVLMEYEKSLVYFFADGGLKITKIKPESKNEMLVSDFVRGNTGFFTEYKDES